MATSGTYDFNLSVPEMILEAFDNLQIRGVAITLDHLVSARRKANLMFQRWSNRGVNLWTVDLQSVPLIQGVAEYDIDPATIMVLDAYLRTFQMGSPTSLTPAFATTNGSDVVTVTQASNGFSVDTWIQIAIPVSIGGLVLLGFYQVQSTPSSSVYTIVAESDATATATGGAVPVFTTVATSDAVSVALEDHGYLAGQTFAVQVSTTVGGITLQGDYTIASVTNADTFVITAPYPAGSSASGAENGGAAQIVGQATNADPIDRILYPISRTDYAAMPDKVQQGPPTTFWFDRLIRPTLTMWQVPDANGPYLLQFYRQRQVQDFNLRGDQSPDLVARFYDAACLELAARLAPSWAPALAQALKLEAKEAWVEAAGEDREAVVLNLTPDLGDYFN